MGFNANVGSWSLAHGGEWTLVVFLVPDGILMDWYTQRVTVCCWDGTLRPTGCLQIICWFCLLWIMGWWDPLGSQLHSSNGIDIWWLGTGTNDKPPERREVSDWSLAGVYVGLVRFWFQHVGMGQNWGQCVAPTQIVLLEMNPSMSGSINIYIYINVDPYTDVSIISFPILPLFSCYLGRLPGLPRWVHRFIVEVVMRLANIAGVLAAGSVGFEALSSSRFLGRVSWSKVVHVGDDSHAWNVRCDKI